VGDIRKVGGDNDREGQKSVGKDLEVAGGKEDITVILAVDSVRRFPRWATSGKEEGRHSFGRTNSDRRRKRRRGNKESWGGITME